MGIYNISETAYAGLQIAQAGMLVTSQNVTGSSVDGFTKRTANAALDALAPNSLLLNGTSFAVDGFTRSYSSLIGSQLLTQQALSSNSDTLVQYTQSIDSLVSDQNTGLTSALTTFFNAMGTYAADPTSQTAAAAITASANNVATRLNGVNTIADTLLSNAKSGLTDTVKQVNTLLPELASINARITAGNSPGNTAPSADLLDERDRILSSLQKLVGGQSLINGDGTATQLVNGTPLVERAVANTLTISPDQTAIGVKFNSKDSLGNSNGQTLQTISGGQGGALLQIINSFVPSIEQRLNAIAVGLVQVANSAASKGSPMTTLIGLQANQQYAHQTVTSAVVASGVVAGNYQIVTSTGTPLVALPAGQVALKNPDGTYTNPVTIAAGTAAGQLVDFGNGIKVTLQDSGVGDTAATIASALGGKYFSVAMQGGGTNVPIFGFRVGNSVFSNLQPNTTDPTGGLPVITSDADLTNMYNSLKNVVTSSLTNNGVIVGSYSNVTSIYADTTKAAPNSYTLSQVFDASNIPTNQIQLTPAPVNGVQGQPQIVTIANGVLGASQSINFSQYGIAINLNNPSTYVSTGIIGLYAGQAIGNQNITSVIASGATVANGGYQIVAGSAAGKVKLSGPGGYLSADVTLSSGKSGGQLIDFGNGVKIELADNGTSDSATTIANQLAGISFTVGTHVGNALAGGESIGAISASANAQAGTYQLSNDGSGNLTISANINGSPISQTVALSDIAVNGAQTINFAILGISLTVNNGNTALSAQTLAQQLAGTSPTNQLVISPGIDTGLDLAASLNNKTFNVTGQTNSALAYGLTAANFVSLAPSNPSGYMNGTTPYISSAAANTVAGMSSVFGNAVANLVSDVGTKVSTWKNNQTANTAVLSNLTSQSNSISGVNLDEEAANLLKYQQLYSASSKVLQVGNQMFNTLLGIMN